MSFQSQKLPMDQIPTNFIYIGPDIPQLGLKRGTLYRDPKPPEQLQQYTDKNPVIRCLYTATVNLALAKRNLKTDPNSVESIAYKMLTEIARKLPR